jgi:hypothetical protein
LFAKPAALQKFLHANICRFADHMKNDKCQQCIAWFRQTNKELKTINRLAAWRKSKNTDSRKASQ